MILKEKYIISVIFFLAFLIQMGYCCPKTCQCKWRNGKRWVTCIGAKFIDIPRGLEASTQVINLQYNNLKILFTDAFFDSGLTNLHKIFLSHCKLHRLEKGSLSKINNLLELDLNSNYLTSVPSEALKDVPGLRELEIRENNLTVIGNDAFSTTPDLVLLDISFNNISVIHKHAFRSLSRLEVLKISGNIVSTVSVSILTPLVALHGFHVHFNPWNCDCQMRPLRKLMIRKNIVTSIPPKCKNPLRLRGRTWKSLELNEFVCIPKVTAITYRILASTGENVSLVCEIRNDPDAKVTWKLGDKYINSGVSNNEQRYKVLELAASENEVDHPMNRLSNLTISSAALQDQGTYKCIVENKAGRVETNMTLKVSKVIKEETLDPVNEMFVAGAILGALLFILLSVIIVSAFLYHRGRQFDDDLLKLSGNHCKISLPLQNLCNDDDLEDCKPNKKYVYESVPTSEIAEVNEMSTTNNDHQIVCNKIDIITEETTDRNILNDLDKNDANSSIQQLANNILHDENISYVKIPKTQISNLLQDQSPLLKNLAQQCRDEIMRRKCIKRSKRSDVPQQYPDLLDFPKEQSSSNFSTLPKRSSTSSDISLENLNFVNSKKNPSLPSSPVQSDFVNGSDRSNPRLNTFCDDHPGGRRQSLTLPLGEAFDLQFHAAQLENFLEEYKNLQEQLFRMKESETNLYADKDFIVLPTNENILEGTHLPIVTDRLCSATSTACTNDEVQTKPSVERDLYYEDILGSPSRNLEPLKSILKTSSSVSREPLISTSSSASSPSSVALLQKNSHGRGVFFQS